MLDFISNFIAFLLIAVGAVCHAFGLFLFGPFPDLRDRWGYMNVLIQLAGLGIVWWLSTFLNWSVLWQLVVVIWAGGILGFVCIAVAARILAKKGIWL